MDIALLSKNSIKIKGKNSAFVAAVPSTDSVLSGSLKTKTPADAVLLLSRVGDFDLSKVEDSRVLIKGQGEYEVSGTKISAFNSGDDIIYALYIDGMEVTLASTDALKKVKDKVNTNVLVLYANSEADQALITATEAKIAVFYGDQAGEAVAKLGKEAKPTPKLSTTADKLPAELEMVVLE